MSTMRKQRITKQMKIESVIELVEMEIMSVEGYIDALLCREKETLMHKHLVRNKISLERILKKLKEISFNT